MKDAQLPFAPQRDSARGDVGDRSVGEADPRVGDVGRTGDDRHADGFDRHDGARHHAEDHVEIVDHQVENDADVRGTAGEWAVALAANVLGLPAAALEFFKGGIKAFDVPDLKRYAVRGGEFH